MVLTMFITSEMIYNFGFVYDSICRVVCDLRSMPVRPSVGTYFNLCNLV